MKFRPALRFPRAAKVLLYGQTLFSLTTGAGWYVLDRWFQTEGDFGLEKHPWQPALLKLHGASAFLALMGFGVLLASHIPVGWRTKRNRVFGLLLLADLLLQITSGYALYYSPPDWHEAVSCMHLWSGLSLPILILLHVLCAHRGRARLGQRSIDKPHGVQPAGHKGWDAASMDVPPK
jgi:hypothetical protein